jgi:protein-L-isoaspartate O-methyltransferase
MTDDWQQLADRLVADLVAKGKVHAPEWVEAVRSVPRHVLVPTYFQQDEHGGWIQRRSDIPEGLATVYSNTALFTALDGHRRGVSSTSQPGLMTRMLELLDISEGHRVLEIGTGTGYNVALLCHRLGHRQVFSVDIDYVDAARERLADLGYHPTLVTTDGTAGLPCQAPFDRIVSTCAVPRIPYAWVRQATDNGLILADLKVGNVAGNLVLLQRDGDTAEGRFDAGYAAFMSARHPGQTCPTRTAVAADATERERATTTSPFCWEEPVPWFLSQFDLPADVVHGMRFDPETGARRASTLYAPDGSRAVVTVGENGHHTVAETGPTPLWQPVENAFQQWSDDLGAPRWERFGLTVTPETQTVWLDSPYSGTTWHLP